VLLKRVLSAVIGIPLLLLLIYQGKSLFLGLMLLLTFIGLFELRQMLGRMKLHFPLPLFYGSGLAFPLLAYFSPVKMTQGWSFALLTLVLLLHLIALLAYYPRYGWGEIAASFMGSAYLGVLLSYLISIRRLTADGFLLILLVLLLTWACDIGAYCCGRLWGKHPLWPAVSPKKTWEGAIGGVLLTVAAALVCRLIWQSFPLYFMMLLGVALSLSVQLGDLVESAVKRQAGVKDSGHIIPGHGGVLDRFDSLLFSAPAAYLLMIFFL
jgi:phosphatidate cytidylyltransferase